MKNLKVKIRKKLHELQIPLLAILSIKYFTRNNIYVEKSRVSKQLLQLLKKLKGYKSFLVSSTGVLILFYKKHVIKIPLGEVSFASMQKNYENYLKLKESTFKQLVDYELIKKDGYYIMERLSVSALHVDQLQELIRGFEADSTQVKIKDVKKELFSNITHLEDILEMKIKLHQDMTIKSCPMHGDLTENNIMKNKDGKVVLIDLDRFTFKGIKGLDFLHYKIDKYSKLQSITFFELLLTDEYIKNELSYFYLVCRVCQEHKENILLNETYYSKIKNCVAILEPKVI